MKFSHGDALCVTCKNTHRKKCSWFDPDNIDVPVGAKCYVARNKQNDEYWQNKFPWHIKIIECPNYEEEK